MPRSEFTFANDPAATERVNAHLAHYNRLRIASIRQAADPRPAHMRLGDAMLDIAAAGQTVDREALALRGFTDDELTEENLRKARNYGNAKSIRQVA